MWLRNIVIGSLPRKGCQNNSLKNKGNSSENSPSKKFSRRIRELVEEGIHFTGTIDSSNWMRN